MIQNDQQLYITKAQRDKFKEAIADFWVSNDRRSRDTVLAQSELNALFSEYVVLSEQIHGYERKKNRGRNPGQIVTKKALMAFIQNLPDDVDVCCLDYRVHEGKYEVLVADHIEYDADENFVVLCRKVQLEGEKGHV